MPAQQLICGDVGQSLAILRKRLLDLTKNNKLLNFRHTKSSSLRIVDELPDELFKRLLDGQKLIFEAVPDPPLSEYGSAELAEESTVKPFDRSKPPASTYARKLGYNTSYELPVPGHSQLTVQHHHDNKIRTLHYQEELEKLLRRILTAANTAIEESGSNMLYLIFGFLEWQELDVKDKSYLAPLFLMPITLNYARANRTTGRYEFSIEYSGEDITTNVSLREFLKQDFQLALQDLTDTDTPESYFNKVSHLLRSKPNWSVRRNITVGLLHFGTLLMYLDLDPARWPLTEGIVSKPRVRELFEGACPESDEAKEYALDSPELAGRVPLLVFDADSSQHSALVDACQGKNLVIQGPPGTGKSQTITNLIAVALANKKKVLFISEKLAALEVVRKRLDEAGLGTFCLELHSHKTQKKEFLKDLDRRLKLRLNAPESLDGLLDSLKRMRNELTDYATLMNSEFGSLRLSIFRLIWLRERLLKSILKIVPTAALPIMHSAESVTPSDLDSFKVHLKTFHSALSDITQSYSSVLEHPWYGVTNVDIGAYEEHKLTECLSELHLSAQSLSKSLKATCASTGLSQQALFSSLSALDEVCGKIKLEKTEILDVLPALETKSNRDRIKEFAELLCVWRTKQSQLESKFVEFPSHEEWNKKAVLEACSDNVVNRHGATIGDVIKRSEALRAILSKIDHSSQHFRSIMDRLGHDAIYGHHSVAALRSLTELAASAPCELLHIQHPGLDKESAPLSLKKASYQASILKEAKTALEVWCTVDSLPSIEDLTNWRDVLVQSNSFSRIFSTRCRKALAAYRLLLKIPGKRPIHQICADLNDAIDFSKKLSAFERNTNFKEVFGEYFGSIDTDFESFGSVLAWKERGRELSATVHNSCQDLIDGFRKAPRAQLAQLKIWLESERQTIEKLEATESEIFELVPNAEDSTDFSKAKERLESLLGECQNALAVLMPLHLVPDEPLLAIPGLLNEVGKNLLLQKEIDNHTASSFLGKHFSGSKTNYESLEATLELAGVLDREDIDQEVKSWLFTPSLPERLSLARHYLNEALPLLTKFDTTSAQFRAMAKLNELEWFGNKLAISRVEQAISRAEIALGNVESLSDWIHYLRCRQEVEAKGLSKVVEFAETGVIPRTHIEATGLFCVINSLIEKCFAANPLLRKFAGMTHNQVRKRFAELDSEVIDAHRAKIAHGLAISPIPAGITSGMAGTLTDRTLIEREIEKERRHIPIRQVIRRAGRALQAMKPCFMMGPHSVAQYLQPGEMSFDLVIMDEASQLKPECAIGAIARAEQVVIVGDPKQLPPTTFFEKFMNDSFEDDNEEDDPLAGQSESILELASVIYKPNRRLRWHYRSRHESLIAFSNAEFYGDLIIFPSATSESPALGVKYRHVNNGIFEHRHNHVEAQKIVDAAVEHMTAMSTESLGIVAMNIAQQTLIQDLIEERRKTNPYVQSYIEARKNGLEPFFVKNLETVQGDERDVILISFTYGRNSEGVLHQRFGPINGDSGHRRLNVVFTRAKRRTEVFTSIDPDDIRIEPSSKWGLRALKGYLHYAKTGILSAPQGSCGSAESDFELTVGQALKERGFQIVPQVGVAGYFIDLGVIHPKHPGTFILGVECDGAAYHSARSARDRDRLREEVLCDLGWNIHRIWSTDWFKNSDKEINRIGEHIKSILEQEQSREEYDERSESDVVDLADHSKKSISVVEARQLLINLREKQIRPAFPDVDPSHGLLRKTMLDALLRLCPTCVEQFTAVIPAAMRSSTDTRHMKFLPQVFEILFQL